MPLQGGTRLGPYEILSPLGAGGMGEVYRARDARLGRGVAIKILPERLSSDPAALSRFDREARAVAALSHPNVLAIHDLGQESGIAYVVMELLEGESLDQLLAHERLSWRRAVEIGAAIADGLSAAHARGVVHRDLKPGNVFVTHDGRVKILDFGLARQSREANESDETAGPSETVPGTVLGTAGYMAPEQVSAEPTDARSDIFSFGCVLYEMLGGRPAFEGRTRGERLAAIMRDHPADLSESGTAIPAPLVGLVRRCLEKNPEARFQSSRDLAFALREMLAGPSASVTSSGPDAASASVPKAGVSRAGRRALWAAAGILIALAAWFVIDRARPRHPSGVRSLAVLPLANFSGDPKDDYFADGMTDELITRLARLQGLLVTSRTSVIGYKGTKKKIRDIARELGVDAILEGSVVRSGDRVKVTAQLIDGSTDRHLWADSYERDVKDVLALQADVAAAVSREVGGKLSPGAAAGTATATRPVLPGAYDAYVRGRHEWNKRDDRDLRLAIATFQESIDADPTYAPAYAGLADCYSALGYQNALAPGDSFPRAKAAAERALALDPSLAEAHAALGYAVMYYDWNFPLAEKEYRRGIELNPSYAVGHQWYGYLLMAMGKPKESLAQMDLAQRLDPLSVPIHTDQAYMLYYSGQSDAAVRAVNMALEMNPKFPIAHFWLGRIYTTQRRFEEAEKEFEKIGNLRAWTPAMAAIGFLYGQWGKPDKARAIIGEFEALAKAGKFASHYAVGVVHAGLGEEAPTLAELETAYSGHEHWLLWLNNDPRFDFVRHGPAFRDLVRRVGLPVRE